MRVLVVGAGKTGIFLAEKLSEENEVTIIEQREDRADLARSYVPNARVITGDACEPEILESANITGCELVAAVTGDDEDNLVVAMLSKVFEVDRVYARVNHPRNEWLFDAEWGVDVAVSGPTILHGLIEKDLEPGDLITLLKLQADGVAIDELTLPKEASSVGKRLADVLLPSNVTVMAILAKDGYVQVARGDTPLVAGDQLLLLAQGDLSQEAIDEAFGIPQPAEEPDEH